MSQFSRRPWQYQHTLSVPNGPRRRPRAATGAARPARGSASRRVRRSLPRSEPPTGRSIDRCRERRRERITSRQKNRLPLSSPAIVHRIPSLIRGLPRGRPLSLNLVTHAFVPPGVTKPLQPVSVTLKILAPNSDTSLQSTCRRCNVPLSMNSTGLPLRRSTTDATW